ncbi:AfsR/SARP family transcriptional regulator [Amycolatopsis sp. H20-H5]|uniref:AfsR/SARP family transcriptional regulator n=1 Tax=Amycolatopsis sp. H20-H5 TaxID=3046309 RepID=UPI002DB84BC1|nr:BTAD domain-containing putative transcriptional regulator [Amycolatopsis sp. H20-H5]MEC3973770.1 BTAD domain-containing putative transcriptional regulator [Amycolatopsis sp. H20-H5]
MVADGSPLALTSARQRALLAALALSAGRLVSIDALARGVWGEEPPERIRGSLQTYVMRLRRLFGEDTVVTELDGYRLTLSPDRVDALRFLRLLDLAAETAHPAGERAVLAEALGLWAGPPLEGVGSPTLTEDWVPQLTERYLFAVERRIDLDAGHTADSDLAAELFELVAQHPLRESLWERLVVVLARSGRRAEALMRYAELRTLLARELGVEPGAELRRLHAELLAGDGEQASPPRPQVPRQLPFDVSGFTGRGPELAELDGFLATRRGDSTAIAIIEGTAGVGKTSLAVHWAHTVRDRFPGGQLFVDLRGHSAGTPVTPDAALARFLRAVGVPAESVPSTVEERSEMLRSRLADARMLLLLDNARDADQVRPLLPGSGTLVVVTSRNQLRGLVAREGARRIPLRTFDDRDAAALLAGSVGRARLEAEPAAVADLAELCGRLPLALALAGERASRFSGISLAGIVDELRDQRVRLDALRDPQDTGTDLRAAFSWSYKALRPPAARLFRLLGLHPGVEIGLPTAAALAGVEVHRARELLDQLASVHLLNQPSTDRYQFHDLLRVYAAERAEREVGEDERDRALRRVLDWYLASVAAANMLVRPDLLTEDVVLEPVEVPTPSFTGHEDTTAWYAAERPALVALVGIAAAHGWASRAWRLAWLLRGFFAERHDQCDWMITATAAVRAARAAADPLGLQYAANNLGSAYLRAQRADEALEALEEGRKASVETGGSALTVAILSNLSGAYYLRAEFQKAEQYASEAVRTAREKGQKTFVPHALLNVSASWIGMREFGKAAEHALAAHEAFDELGDRYHSALALGNTGEALSGAQRHAEAEEYCVRALVVLNELAADYGKIDVLITLGRIKSRTGRPVEAAGHWTEALAVGQRLGDPRTDEIQALLAALPSAGSSPGAAPHP